MIFAIVVSGWVAINLEEPVTGPSVIFTVSGILFLVSYYIGGFNV